MLVDDGWSSPDTHDNFYSPISEIPAIYLFLLHERTFYEKAIVGYVGMSRNLLQRLSSHEVLAEIRCGDFWAMRWFKPTARPELRRTEKEYIAKFDPPWNIIGRQRGIA